MTRLSYSELGEASVTLVAARADTRSDWLAQAFRQCASDDEKQRNQRYRMPRDQQRDKVVRVLVRHLLAQLLDMAPHELQLLRDDKGKPFIAQQPLPLHFNVSHSGDWAVLALAKPCVGVDIEYVPRSNDVLAIAEHYFHPSETAQLFAQPEAQQRDRFFDYWTLKEAYIKARGEGIGLGLKNFGFDLTQSPIALYTEPSIREQPKQWRFLRCSPLPDYRLSVALRQPAPIELSLREMRDDGDLCESTWHLGE